MKTHSTLGETLHREWGLVLFTTLVPAAAGIVLIGVLAGLPREAGITALAVTVVGLLASIGHLARPFRAPFSIRHLATSWLSREILMSVMFFILCAGWTVTAWLNGSLSLYLGIACLVAAVPLFFVMGRSYRIWSRPAWDGPEIFTELIAVCLVTGLPAGTLAVAFGEVSSCFGWFATGGVAAGLAADWWATKHRLRRLQSFSADRYNARESIAHYHELRPYFRVMVLLGIMSLLAAVITMTTNFYVPGWSVASTCGLASRLLSRSLFYALPVQRRYAVSLRAVRPAMLP